MFRLFRCCPVVGLILAFVAVSTYVCGGEGLHTTEKGLHTLPFGGAASGASNTWGHSEGILFVRGFDSRQDNQIFKSREGIVFLEARRPKCAAPDRTVCAAVRLKLDCKSGRVLSVALVQSTGQTVLDRTALEALTQWRTRSGVKLDSVDIPIVFLERPRTHGAPHSGDY